MSDAPADWFGAVADAYERSRPRYPEDLFDLLAARAPARRIACDCASGNGQAARPLLARFATVLALDASAAQLASAAPGLLRAVARAERLPLATGCVDLLTVAQALHWFDRAAFFAEARRVLAPGGVLAVWTYNLCEVAPAVDALVRDFHQGVLGPWWTGERKLVDDAYAGIELPLSRTEILQQRMSVEWTLEAFVGYLGTWSAVTRCRSATGRDPLAELLPALRAAWGPVGTRTVAWPLTVKLARKA